MRLLFSGASGFLGKNIFSDLKNICNVETIGLSATDNYRVDISKGYPLLSSTFDIVLHAAGKAHVLPRNEADKQAFYDVNYQGTVNLCRGLEKCGTPKAFVFISTVAVYGCEFGENITEEHPLNGTTPYAESKIMAENYLKDWCARYDVRLSILRPSLIAGPSAPGNLGAMINAIKKGFYFNIGKGETRKSILMVQDIARLIPLLIDKGGIYNVCDDINPSMSELSELIASQLGKRKPLNIPYGLIRLAASVGDTLGDKSPINSLRLKKLTHSLTFSNEKAKRELGWNPLSVLDNYKIE